MPTVTAVSVAATARAGIAALEVALVGERGELHAIVARGLVDHEAVASAATARSTAGAALVERVLNAPGVRSSTVTANGRIDNLTATPVRVRVGVTTGRLLLDRSTVLTAVTPPITVRPRREVRFLAQRVLDRRWLSWNLPVRNPQIGWRLNGATEIAGAVDARDLYEAGIDEWATYLHAERDGQIVASAIVLPFSPGGAAIDISAAGVTRYPHGQPYQGDFKLGSPVGVGIDPLDVVRDIWTHLSTYPDGKLGVLVAATKSTVKVGEVDLSAYVSTPGYHSDGPYLLKWWEETDCGKEIDDLAQQTPFDYREAPRWNADRTDVLQFVDLGYPRLGRDQPDLAFTEGQNLTEALTPIEDDDRYASEVIVLGSGEGTARVRGRYGASVGRRVRRAVTVEDKTITTLARADSKARNEWLLRRGDLSFEKIALKARHLNAPLGSFAVGDDVPARARVDGIGQVDIRHRVTALDWDVDASTLVATCARSDSFTYQPPVKAS